MRKKCHYMKSSFPDYFDKESVDDILLAPDSMNC